MFVIPFPVINPVALQIGPLSIHWYGLAYMVGILLAWWMASLVCTRNNLWLNDRSPISSSAISDFVVWSALGIILGGRLGYILFYNFEYFIANPDQIFTLNMQGMAFHGGLIGILVACLFFVALKKVPLIALFDVLALVAPIGLFLGRIANFINGELYGRISNMPWAMVFPDGGPIPRHPSQLYEAALEGLMIFVVLFILVFKRKIYSLPGMATGLFLILYGCSRIFVEFFRQPDEHIGTLHGFMTMGMILSLPLVVIGFIFILYAQRKIRLPARLEHFLRRDYS